MYNIQGIIKSKIPKIFFQSSLQSHISNIFRVYDKKLDILQDRVNFYNKLQQPFSIPQSEQDLPPKTSIDNSSKFSPFSRLYKLDVIPPYVDYIRNNSSKFGSVYYYDSEEWLRYFPNIGFSGAPWTLATYMIEGHGTKNYYKSKKILYTNPILLDRLLEILSNEIKQYLSLQIQAGVNAIMLFDSWANALEESQYLAFGWKYLRDIASYIKHEYPNIPIIIFPRGVGAYLEKLYGDFDVLGIDWQISMQEAKHKVGNRFVLQGNLEPARLYDYDSMRQGVEVILNTMRNRGHIFNLGHGMIEDLPRDNAIALVRLVRELSSQFC